MPIDATADGKIKVYTLEEMNLPAFDGAAADVKTDFIVHHTTGSNLGDPDKVQWWKNIYQFHTDPPPAGRGWLHIGYNFGVAEGETADEAMVLTGRGYYGVGAHTLGFNYYGLGCAFLGDEGPTPGVLRALRLLWDTASDGVFKGRLKTGGHRDYNTDTECPGDDLEAWVQGGLLVASVVDNPVILPPPKPGPKDVPPVAPPFPLADYPAPDYILDDNAATDYLAGPAIGVWQQRMADRGWVITVDGIYGPRSASVCTEFQKEKGLAVDGIVGPVTWDAAWSAPIT